MTFYDPQVNEFREMCDMEERIEKLETAIRTVLTRDIDAISETLLREALKDEQ